MARTRRRRSKRTNHMLVIVQITGLVTILVFILLFRRHTATTAGAILGAFGPEDVKQVDSKEPAPKTDP